MAFLWKALDYIPVVGAVKNAGEAVVALVQGDFSVAASKTAEAAVGGTLDYLTLGAGNAIAKAVVKESGKAITKGIGKEMTKIAAKEVAAKIVVGSVAVATATRVVRKRNRSPSPFRFSGRGSSTAGSSSQQTRSNTRQRSGSEDRCNQATSSGGGSGQEPNRNDDNKRAPGRGYHIINNDIVKLIRKLIERFLQNNGFSYLQMENRSAISSEMQLFQDYNHPLPQRILDTIQNELVVRTVEILDDPNDATYGDYRQRLEDAYLEYMTALYDLINENYELDYIQEQVNNARTNVISLIDEIISDGIFIDQTSLSYWCTEHVDSHFPSNNSRIREREVRRQKFEEAKQAVEEMLRGLADKAEVWVREIIQAIENYCNNLNRRQN